MAGRRGSSDRSGGGYASRDTGVDDDVDLGPKKSMIRHRLPSGDVKRPPERLWMAQGTAIRAGDPGDRQTRQTYGGIDDILQTAIAPPKPASSIDRTGGSSSEGGTSDMGTSSDSGGGSSGD